MKRIGVIANCGKPHSGEVLERLERKALEQKITLVTCDSTGDALTRAETVRPEEMGREADVLLALGGDGTMLHAVRLINGADTPVLGVNLGSLGFMTSVTEEELEYAIDVLVARRFYLSTRVMLDGRVHRDGTEIIRYTALNDIVVGWGSSSRALVLGLSIDGEEVAQYFCDGLIVSTPTGSTGHSLSAGGPIIHPQSPVLNISAICPHTLSARPLVLSDQSTIHVDILDAAPQKRPLLSADGQEEYALEKGDRLTVTRHSHPVRFVHLPEYSYFSVLRHKLHWLGNVR